MFSLDIWNYWEELAWGVYSTMTLSLAAMVLGLLVAVLCALVRTTGHPLLNRFVSIYVEVIRNTPFLVQIFLVYFGLPTLGIRFSPTTAALLALVLNVGAYCTEIVRAGIESIHKGQIEAGKALGLSTLKIFFLIIIPPAIQNIYPALTGQFILSMLSTSVLSAISAEELTSIAGDIQSRNFRTTEVYIATLIIYYAITLVCMGLFAIIARWAFPNRYAKGMR